MEGKGGGEGIERQGVQGGLAVVTRSLCDGAHFLCVCGLCVINTEVWEAQEYDGSHVPLRQEGIV